MFISLRCLASHGENPSTLFWRFLFYCCFCFLCEKYGGKWAGKGKNEEDLLFDYLASFVYCSYTFCFLWKYVGKWAGKGEIISKIVWKVTKICKFLNIFLLLFSTLKSRSENLIEEHLKETLEMLNPLVFLQVLTVVWTLRSTVRCALIVVHFIWRENQLENNWRNWLLLEKTILIIDFDYRLRLWWIAGFSLLARYYML